MQQKIYPMKRASSLNAIKRIKNNHLASLAQKNLVSLRQPDQKYYLNRPLRICLPDYFNIPKFHDKNIDLSMNLISLNQKQAVFDTYRDQKGLKKKLKDLSILAEGMKRAKNIKQQSRYYFIQGVILHNSGMWQKSIQMFQKFLKIVLFIKDDKSIELALNSIANCYMYMNKPQQALQYHQKQTYLNENTQYFIGKVNIGFCLQMLGRKAQAYHIYSDLADIITNLTENKLSLLENLLERTKNSKVQNYFITEDNNKKTLVLPKISPKNNQKHQKQNLPEKNTFHVSNHFKKSTQKMLNHSFSSKKYDSIKVNYAIFSAEQNLNTYLQDMKHSFSKQNN